MTSESFQVERLGLKLHPDASRVLVRPFRPASEDQSRAILRRVIALDEAEVRHYLARVLKDFHERHTRLEDYFEQRYDQVRHVLPSGGDLSASRRRLAGAYFSHEYALESTALFNPSIVPHPDQDDLAPGELRTVLSLRATGEGHLSSITFRSVLLSADGEPSVVAPSRFVTAPEPTPNALYERKLFRRKLHELGVHRHGMELVLRSLGAMFTMGEMEVALARSHAAMSARGEWEHVAAAMRSLAESNFEIRFDPETTLSERIIFPAGPHASNGMEDARFVKFSEPDGSCTWYATFTAWDGRVFLPQMLETRDFLHFKVRTLNGPEVQNKGMALFPRKIRGRYFMLSRQDNENLYIMSSDMVHFWYTRELLMRPREVWSTVQVGNCGSPIETEEGWLVITHGVGPMRQYSLGAILLDLENPGRIRGRLKRPLLSPQPEEREGYVPNVVYSCGALVHQGWLVLPYAVSDQLTAFCRLKLADLLDALLSSGSP